MITPPTPFGKRLRGIRLRKKWTLQQLADKSRVPLNSISSYERGVNEPGLTNLVSLADALGVTLDYLTARSNP